jgi:hypothetical protein
MKVSGRLINGDRLAEIADIVFGSRYQKPLTVKQLQSALKPFNHDVAIVYMDTDLTNLFFDVLTQVPAGQLIIVTHNGDAGVQQAPRRECDADFGKINASVFRWFAQNVQVADPRVVPIPIGLERTVVAPAARKEYHIRVRMGRASPRRHLLYMNHSISTNARERAHLYKFFSGRPWVFSRSYPPGIPYTAYLDELCASYFCLSPPGNGLDCHRTWEALYVGCYPVLQRSTMTQKLYSDLPVVLVDDYEEVTESRLNAELERIRSLSVAKRRFFVEYYHHQILDAAAQAGSQIVRAIPRPSWRERLENTLAGWRLERG